MFDGGPVRFGQCQFDPLRGELRRGGELVPLMPQAIELLTYLLDHRDRPISRAELLDQVWKSVAVSDGALGTAIYELRAALGDDGRRQQVIRTVRGRGFQFVAAVEEPQPGRRVDERESVELSHHRAAAADCTPFVGRDLLLDQFRRCLEDAVAGRPRVLLLEGEAGIGKTRVARVFAASVQGARLGFGHCYEHAGAPPFWPWVQVLRATMTASDAAELRRLFGARAAALFSVSLQHGEGRPRRLIADAQSGAEARFQLFDGVATVLRKVSATVPLVLILDDIHCADHASLLLLEYLAAELAGTRMLLIATYRGGEGGAGHRLPATLATLARSALCEHHRLGRLTPVEVRELIAALAGERLSPLAVERIVRRTEGNPLFVTELTRQVRDRGEELEPDGDLPAPVHEIIRRHVERLAPLTQQALGVAAVLGREFRVDFVARTWDRPAPLPADWLEEAVRSQIVTITARNGGAARFSHALFHEAFYGRLDLARRMALHRRAGEALEAGVLVPAPADVAALAHHFSAALSQTGETAEKAVAYSVAAARSARDVMAYEEAVDHYAAALRALECSERPDPVAYAEVLLGLADAQAQAGDIVGARETFTRAATAARCGQAGRLLARAALGYTAATDPWERLDNASRQGPTGGRAATLLSEALTDIGEHDAMLRTRLQAALAVTDTQRTAEERNALSASALACAEQLDDPTLLVEVVSGRRELLWAPENLQHRLELASTVVTLALRTGDREHELRGRTWRLIDLLERGDISAVYHELETCDRLAQELGQLRHRYHVSVLRGSLALLAGRYADVERYALEALTMGRRMRNPAAELVHTAQLVAMRRMQGRLAEIVDRLREIVMVQPLYSMRCAFAHVLADMGRLEEASIEFELLARENFADVARDTGFLCSLAVLSEVCYSLADRRRAALLYDLLEPFAERNIVATEGVVSLGAAAHALGEMATLLERWDDAERHFRAALALNLRLGAGAYMGPIERAYGEMLLARDGPGDRARGLAMLDRSLATAERYGAHGLYRRVMALRERALASPRDADEMLMSR